MSSVIIAGDTSGTVTLQAPAVSGSTVLNLPTLSGGTLVTSAASGNVGIGTNSPEYKLDVTGVGRITGNADQQYNFRVQHSTTGFGLYQDDTTGYTSISAYDTSGTTYGKGLIFATAAAGSATTERMRIDSSGRVLAGRSSAYVDGSIGSATFQTASVTGSNAGIAVIADTTTSTAQIGFVNPNGTVGAINSNGSATSYVTSSDYRLKENIAPMIGALDTVALLKPVTYKWKVDGSDGQGFIAHELQEVVPDCVTGKKDAVETYTDEDGVEQTRPAYQGIDTSFLVATLTAAIQELKAELDTVKTELAALKGSA